MKKILILVLIALSQQAAGQAWPTGWVPYNSKNRHIGLAADSLMYIPVKDTTHTPQRIGAITMRPQDSCVYVGVRTTAGTKRWERIARFSDIGSSYTFPLSVIAPGNAIQLDNDTSAAVANYFYGTNSVGRRTWLPQSGIVGVTPTWQETLTAGSTMTEDNSVDLQGFDFQITGGAGTSAFSFSNLRSFGVGLASNDRIVASPVSGSTGETSINSGLRIMRFSSIKVLPDSLLINPSSGNLFIDSLNYTISTVGKKIMLRDTATGLVENIDPALIGGGGGTPAGNFGNVQINRNGAFATPGSDSLDFESATGLTVKGGIRGTTLGVNVAAPTTTYAAQINGDATYTTMLRLNTGESYPRFISFETAFGQNGYIGGTFKGVEMVLPLSDGSFTVSRGASNLANFNLEDGLKVGRRFQTKQGADVASANNLVLGGDGSVFEITGTTTINLIANTNWQNGSEVTLLLESGITVSHNTTSSGSNITILLAGAANFTTTAPTVLNVLLSEVGGVQAWREVSRTVF